MSENNEEEDVMNFNTNSQRDEVNRLHSQICLQIENLLSKRTDEDKSIADLENELENERIKVFIVIVINSNKLWMQVIKRR